MLKPWESNDQQLSACYFIIILVVWGNSQGIPSPKEKEKEKNKKDHSSKVVKTWWAPEQFGYPWYVKEKVGRSAKVLKKQKNMGTTS
jgi:hypothetical protein